MMKRFCILLFSLVYAVIVISTFGADRLAATGRIDPAIKLDPVNAEYYFQKYKLLEQDNSQSTIHNSRKQQLALIKRAIDLRPFWPEYHLYYAVILDKMTPETNIMTRRAILEQLRQAAELKPYSPSLQKGVTFYNLYLT